MLAFTVFWAYIGFSQYMLIWYANIPEETEYFILRNTESWNLMSLLLMIGRFFIPFALLLMRSTKKQVRIGSACVAGWIIFMQLLDMYIVVMPELHRHRRAPEHHRFPAAHRHRRDPGIFLPPHRRESFALPGA